MDFVCLKHRGIGHILVIIGIVCSVVLAQRHVIYIDPENGVEDKSCWTGGRQQPCRSLDIALKGARMLNATVYQTVSSRQSQYVYPNLSMETYMPVRESKHFWQKSSGLRALRLVPEGKAAVSNKPCPTWFRRIDNTSSCTCGDELGGIVRCDNKSVSILHCYCMTYSESTKETLVGSCLYSCFDSNEYGVSSTPFTPLPSDVSHLNKAMCGQLHRRGRLCGQCDKNYHIPFFAYGQFCMNCTYSRYNWVKYAFVAFTPLTLFIIIVFACRINVNSPPLHAFVLVSQLVSIPSSVRILIGALDRNSKLHWELITVKALSSLYGIWNLDFLRTIVPPFCVNISFIHALTQDYIYAFFPLLVITVVYIFAYLHARNCRLVVWMWNPVYICFARFRRQLDIKTPIIKTFATFLLLSYTKFLTTSYDLLLPTSVYNVTGHRKKQLYLYYDATVEFFGREHLPFAILAVLVLIFINLTPLLLLTLYSFRWFQRCLGCCNLNCQGLHMFIDAFQGCFKDGTEGTRDFRYFAAAFLWCRIILCAVYAWTLSVLFWYFISLFLLGFALSIIILQPYKRSAHNIINASVIIVFTMYTTSVESLSAADAGNFKFLKPSFAFSFIFGTIPLVYGLALLLHWLYTKRLIQRLLICRCKFINCCFRHHHQLDDPQDFPDRIVNPDRYGATAIL